MLRGRILLAVVYWRKIGYVKNSARILAQSDRSDVHPEKRKIEVNEVSRTARFI